jgi:hypothetical protein
MTVFFNTSDFATTVTYNSVAIVAIWTPGENQADNPPSTVREGRLEVKITDVAAPAYRDSVIIDGVTWRVRRVISGDEYTWLLALETSERPKL